MKITKESIKESYKKLEERSANDIAFIFLTATAAAICAFGFRMNSPSVIVGSMVISPILYPAVALSADIYWRKWSRVMQNLYGLLIGILLAVLISYIINKIFPTFEGSEIVSRITSNQLDYFFVALFSGMGGTFAFFWPDIIEAIAGIAISVALIPPIVMIGIGLARMQSVLILSSIEIVGINIFGIALGAFLVIILFDIFLKNTK